MKAISQSVKIKIGMSEKGSIPVLDRSFRSSYKIHRRHPAFSKRIDQIDQIDQF